MDGMKGLNFNSVKQTIIKNNEMRKALLSILVTLLFITCGQKKTNYETKDWFSSNISLSYQRIYPGEHMILKVNSQTVFDKTGDSSLYPALKLFNFPDSIKSIEFISYHKGSKILNGRFDNQTNSKRIAIVVSYAYPKDLTYPVWPIKKEWFFLPVDSITRHVIIEPDTIKGQIILQEDGE